MGKNAQEKVDTASKTIKEATKNKNTKIIIGIVVLLIIALNTIWNMTDSKITTEVESLRAQIAALGDRVDETLKFSSSTDLEALEAKVISIEKAKEVFDARLNAVLKVEEAKLEMLTKALEEQRAYVEKALENQRTYVEELKNLLAGN